MTSEQGSATGNTGADHDDWEQKAVQLHGATEAQVETEWQRWQPEEKSVGRALHEEWHRLYPPVEPMDEQTEEEQMPMADRHQSRAERRSAPHPYKDPKPTKYATKRQKYIYVDTNEKLGRRYRLRGQPNGPYFYQRWCIITGRVMYEPAHLYPNWLIKNPSESTCNVS